MPNPNTFHIFVKGNKGCYALNINDTEGNEVYEACQNSPSKEDTQEITEWMAIDECLKWLDEKSALTQCNFFIFTNTENLYKIGEGNREPDVTKQSHQTYEEKLKTLTANHKINKCTINWIPKNFNNKLNELSDKLTSFKGSPKP